MMAATGIVISLAASPSATCGCGLSPQDCINLNSTEDNPARPGGRVTERRPTTAEVYAERRPARRGYGLHAGVLGPIETLAQSVFGTKAQSTSPCAHYSAGVCAGRQCDVVYVFAGHYGDAAGGLLRIEPLRAHVRNFARLALFPTARRHLCCRRFFGVMAAI